MSTKIVRFLGIHLSLFIKISIRYQLFNVIDFRDQERRLEATHMKVEAEREEERKVSREIIIYANNDNTHNIINNIHVNNREGIK